MLDIMVLVTGATGAVGRCVVQALHESGCGVRILSRDAPGPELLPNAVEVFRGDVTDLLSVRSAVQDVDAVIHLAALLHILSPAPVLREQYERINVGGTATVVEAAVQAGVERLVFSSTIAVYGYGSGQVLTEDTPPHPESFYAQTKLAAEQIVLSAKRPDGRQLGTVLRLGAVYGARIKGNYRRLVQALARGRFIPVGDGRARRTLIYDRDVAWAAMLAAQHAAAAGQIYNVSDGHFHRLNDIIVAICKALGRAPPRFSVPTGLAHFAAGLLEDAAGLVGRQSPIGRVTIEKYTEDVAADSRRIQTELGFVPQFDLREGWRETIQEMRRAGDL